jgi:hypothetical protein
VYVFNMRGKVRSYDYDLRGLEKWERGMSIESKTGMNGQWYVCVVLCKRNEEEKQQQGKNKKCQDEHQGRGESTRSRSD